MADDHAGRPDAGPGRRRAKAVARAALRGFEGVGIHVLPRHFYSSVPDRRWLSLNGSTWQVPASLTGVRWDLDEQLAWLGGVCTDLIDEVTGFAFLPSLRARQIPFRYGLIEAEILHCFIRSARPRRIVEVGSGASTAVMADAAERNTLEGADLLRIVAVDPNATKPVTALHGVETIRAGALEAPSDVFASLSEGDLLFIDSSHSVKTGSELARLYLEAIPQLAAGVVIHVHDTYLPYLYSPWVLEDIWDWQETTLLLALLTNNPHLEVLCAESALHHGRPRALQAIVPDYVPLPMEAGIVQTGAHGHFPSSTWLRTR